MIHHVCNGENYNCLKRNSSEHLGKCSSNKKQRKSLFEFRCPDTALKYSNVSRIRTDLGPEDLEMI